MPVSIPSRIAGVLLMVVTIGLASCQALFLEQPTAPPAIDQVGED